MHAPGEMIPPEREESLIRTVQLAYALHALGLILGAFGAATVLGSFLFGWPSIIAVIINYAKRGEARGTWLESHFSWQIRTFWYALLWSLLVGLVSALLAIVLVGFALWVLGLVLLGVWVTYRVIRGWLALRDRMSMPL